jgi:ubiquinone/menaquinone biosynthesis C-methylase UbiE/uncharacterized protein YbaR (Trm112 family)
MQKSLAAQFLCCPVDRTAPLLIEGVEWRDEELITGALRCPQCGGSYPVVNGIPRLFPPTSVQSQEVAAAKERESQARDADAAVYDASVADYHTTIELGAIFSRVRAKPGDIILDLGAGTGRLTTLLAQRGAFVIALDISPQSLEMNQRKCAGLPGARAGFIACDACYLPLRDSVANKAVSGMMLEHIPTPAERQRCLEEIRRVLQPRGRVALTVYNYSLSKRRHKDREGFHGGALYYYRFDRAELQRLLGAYRAQSVTGLLNLPRGLQSRLADNLIARFPPVAGLMGDLLFAVAER